MPETGEGKAVRPARKAPAAAAEKQGASAQRYAVLATGLLARPGVTVSERRGFSRGGLMAAGKLFATLHGDALLLKLPPARVAALIAAGGGRAFDAGKGRPMKAWVLVEPDQDWDTLAALAAAYVMG